MLPIRLVKFWFFDALGFFFRTWQHTLSFLEEDLAVSLMLKLLFVPLFHDSSFTGQVLSFFFRLFRVLVGFLAYLAASLFLLSIALIWFSAPILLFLPIYYLNYLALGIIFFGLAVFLDRYLFYPEEKFWHIRVPKDIWRATKVSKNIKLAKLLNSHEVKDLLFNLEIDSKEFRLNSAINEATLQKIFDLGRMANAKYITEGYFFVAFLHQTPGVETELIKLNLKLEDFDMALIFIERKRKIWRKVFVWDEEFGVTHLKGVNRGWLGAPTPTLDSVSTDLTRQAAKSGFNDFIGREGIVSEVVNLLSQKQDHNVCLVGPSGSGKSSLVSFLAKKIIAGDAPEGLATKRLVSLDLSKLLAGAKTQGDIAAKIEAVFSEAEFSQNIILYLDEIQNFTLGDAGNSFNIFSLLLTHLESSNIQYLASTEPGAYSKIIEKAAFFARVFHKIDLPPATTLESEKILIERSIEVERAEGIKFSFLSLRKLADLATRLIHDLVLPDSAISVFNEAARLGQNGLVRTSQVKEVFQKRVNVPLMELDSSAKGELLNLEQRIHQNYIDQEEAVKEIADTLRRSATGLRESNRPIGSFLFVGPTGVGKTELAKRLCEVYFSDKSDNQLVSVSESQKTDKPINSEADNFFRFDMSEYQTQESVSRLIGDSSNPGLLTEAVKSKQYCLILLDEFEKADPKLLSIFLQVLDDGRLTDSSGKTIDFTNTIIIATSNAASLTIAEGLESGLTIETLKPKVNAELLSVFKPELVNRFDSVVIFKPLSLVNLEKIVRIKLSSLQQKLKSEGFIIDFSPDLIVQLAQKGFDPVLGARPLRRLIQDTLEANLSKMILENKLQKGQMTILNADILV